MQHLHLFFYAIALGLGAAIPIGPINLEIIRRNLQFGTRSGVLLGLGASCTDLTYVLLLSLGALAILSHTIALAVVGFIGALVLAWFGVSAFRMKPTKAKDNTSSNDSRKPAFQHWRDGYLMTALNPMTVIFWSSVSSQVASLSSSNHYALLEMAAGVIIGAFSWALSLNAVLHHTRHRISPKIMGALNKLGGLLLILFAVYGIVHTLHLLSTI